MAVSNKVLSTTIGVMLGVAVFCFWAFGNKAILSYQEQMQLFQTTSTYLAEHLTWPGGMATYISEYLTQFYNNYWIGALILSAIFMLIYWALAALCKKLNDSPAAYPLAMGPVLLLWMYIGDINVMPSFIISVLFALLCAWWYFQLKHYLTQSIGFLFGLPVFYWLFGPASLLLAVLMAIKSYNNYPKHHIGAAIFSFLILAYTVAIIFLCSAGVNYPLRLQFVGINYYRIPTVTPILEYVVEACFAATVALCLIKAKSESKISWGIFTMWILLCAAFWNKFYDTKTNELIEYDYLVRTNNWDAIIKKAEKQQPDLPMSVCATNLALGMKGQLGDRAFLFYQNGTEGLIPPFQRESNTQLVTAEAFFQLGLINEAQRFYFEAMEAIPNFNKSVRCIKRLAEINMINGQYDVARKYLRMLENTTFYNKWAKRTAQLIDNNAIDSHPLYGRLRLSRLQNDFLFSDTEIDKIMGQLFLKNPQNALAMQYLLVYPMLERNMPKLINYLQVVQDKVAYNPTHCQQAVAFHAVQNHQDIPQGMVSQPIIDHFRNFARTMSEHGKQSQAMDTFRGTLWYYLTIE